MTITEADILHEEIATLRDYISRIQAIFQAQSTDTGIWAEANTGTEAYLQKQIIDLHRVIEDLPEIY